MTELGVGGLVESNTDLSKREAPCLPCLWGGEIRGVAIGLHFGIHYEHREANLTYALDDA